MKQVCDVCGWEYDEEKGYPEGGIALAFTILYDCLYIMLFSAAFQQHISLKLC